MSAEVCSGQNLNCLLALVDTKPLVRKVVPVALAVASSADSVLARIA